MGVFPGLLTWHVHVEVVLEDVAVRVKSPVQDFWLRCPSWWQGLEQSSVRLPLSSWWLASFQELVGDGARGISPISFKCLTGGGKTQGGLHGPHPEPVLFPCGLWALAGVGLSTPYRMQLSARGSCLW